MMEKPKIRIGLIGTGISSRMSASIAAMNLNSFAVVPSEIQIANSFETAEDIHDKYYGQVLELHRAFTDISYPMPNFERRKDFEIKCQWQYPKFNKKGKVKR